MLKLFTFLLCAYTVSWIVACSVIQQGIEEKNPLAIKWGGLVFKWGGILLVILILIRCFIIEAYE